ncbi:MAG: PEP-CTERM sorting domain-containing protein [Rhodanobacteraceae bacterium]
MPVGYASDSTLSSSSTWDNANFASLGVTPATYTWTWGTGADQSFTLDVVTSVPEPAALGMFGLGLLLMGGFAGLRRRVA